MTARRFRLVVSIAATCSPLLYAGCGSKPPGPERLPTVPVRGTVTVDGTPAAKLTVRLHNKEAAAGESAVYAAHPSALTGDDGTFAVSTYESGDGVAPGTYAVTFEWLKYDAFRNAYGPPDRLKGRYADPAKATFEVKVEPGAEAVEAGPFALTTK